MDGMDLVTVECRERDGTTWTKRTFRSAAHEVMDEMYDAAWFAKASWRRRHYEWIETEEGRFVVHS